MCVCVCVQLEAAVERANKYHGDKLSKQMKVSSCVSYGTCIRYLYSFLFLSLPLGLVTSVFFTPALFLPEPSQLCLSSFVLSSFFLSHIFPSPPLPVYLASHSVFVLMSMIDFRLCGTSLPCHPSFLMQ